MSSVTAHLPPAQKAVLSAAQPFRRGAAAAALPQRVKILAWGENLGRTTGARILVDDAVAASLAANQERVACDLVPMDYEHQSEPSHPNFLPDPRLSPGGGRIEVVPGEGVFLSGIAYTPNGQQFADSYQDVSAVVHLDHHARPLWISSVALTQRGDLAGMELAESIAALSATATLSSHPPQANPAMTPPDETTFRAILLTYLGLPADTTDEDLIAAASSEPAEPKPESIAALSARVLSLEGSSSARARQDLVDRACREGKAIPLSAALIAQTPVAVLSAMVDGLPAGTVPLTLTPRRELPAATTAALSADEKGAAKRLGLTEEEFLKGKP